MRKISLWGLGALAALGVGAFLLAAQVGLAQKAGGPFNANNVAEPGDQLDDYTHDRPGVDRKQDRIADSTPDQINDGTPDCLGNFAGDDNGNCNSSGGSGVQGDSTPEDIQGDSIADAIPDASRFMTINRALERAIDYAPDWPQSDTYRRNNGLPTSEGDGVPDSFNDTDVRAHDSTNDSLTSGPDAINYAFGPGDKSSDGAYDYGGLGFSVGGGGGGGCSMVAARATDGTGLTYLLLLLAPVAFVAIRRAVSRR